MLQLLTRVRHGEPLRAWAVFRDAFCSLVRVFLPQNLPLLLYGVALIPLTNFFLAANHLTQFAVPEYLWGLLKARPGNRLLFALAVLCVLALLLLLPAVIAYLLNKYWVNKKSFVTVTGKPTQVRKLIEEPHIKWPLFAFCLIVSAIIILFYGTVIFASFVRTWGVDFSLTLDQYRKALQYGWDSLKNSMTLGLISAVIGGLLGMVIAYITAKRNYFGKRFIEISSVLMFAVPGTVLGISYILGFNSKPLALTGTGIILVIVFTFRNMPVAIESGTTTLLQIDNSIEEASTILGADTGYSFRRITLPMLKNAFFSGIVYSFTKAITAVSAVIFLVSPRWKLVTSNIYSPFDMAKYGQAAAFVTMMVGILLVFIGLFNTVINFLLAPRSKVPQAKTKTEESK